MPDERYEFIKAEVVYMFERFGVSCVPINGFELAYKMGIRLIPYSTLADEQRKAAMTISPDGFFLETVDEERIHYNDENIRENYARVNMTILHETAHDVLGHTGMEECADKEETAAGFFAKYAAAPPPLVHRLPMVTMKVRATLASAGKVDKEISETLFRMILLKAQRLSMTLLGMAGLKSHWLTVKASGSL